MELDESLLDESLSDADKDDNELDDPLELDELDESLE